MKKVLTTLSTLAAAALLTVGCATTPTTDDLTLDNTTSGTVGVTVDEFGSNTTSGTVGRVADEFGSNQASGSVGLQPDDFGASNVEFWVGMTASTNGINLEAPPVDTPPSGNSVLPEDYLPTN